MSVLFFSRHQAGLSLDVSIEGAPGYSGLNCSEFDPCASSPCNMGNCTAFANGTFECACRADGTSKNDHCDTIEGRHLCLLALEV